MDIVTPTTLQVTPIVLAAVDEDGIDKLPLMRTSVIIAMVMLLKAHLKSLYSLSEMYVTFPLLFQTLVTPSRKINKVDLRKKTAAGDKAAVRRIDTPISWARLPFATSPMLTMEDIKLQKTKVSSSMNLGFKLM